MCPENRVIFTCQQSGSTEWDIHLQPTSLMQTAQVTQAVGSVIRFGVDRGFNFELHIVSSISGNFTTQLQVTAVRELDNVTVGCRGQSGTFLSTIQVAASLPGELNLSLATNVVKTLKIRPAAAPSGVMARDKQFIKTGASVNVTWSTSRGADNYTVNVTPPIMPGQLSDFTTTSDTSLLLVLLYNVNYTINITAIARDCAGSNNTIFNLTIGKIIIYLHQCVASYSPPCSCSWVQSSLSSHQWKDQ